VVEGMPTAIPFHRAVVHDPAFYEEPFRIHTRWIETEFNNTIPPYVAGAEVAEPAERERVVVEVGGRRIEVTLPAGLGVSTGSAAAGGASAGKTAPVRRGRAKGAARISGDALTSPMQGTIVKVAVEDGQVVAKGDVVVVLEAMKMEQPLAAHKDGTVTALQAEIGTSVTSGAVICEIKD